MNIALIGYGKMGKEIEQVVRDGKKHTIVSVSARHHGETLDTKGIAQADVAIEFTAPDMVLQNIKEVALLGTHMVIGTTGWYDKVSVVKKLVTKHNIGLVYGSNFSIGANLFFKITDYASLLFTKFPQYDIYGIETHHTGKKDSPSGTAKTLGDIIIKNMKAKKTFQNERVNRVIGTEELHFASIRAGVNPGRHEIVFDSVADEVRFIHQARGRRGFAEGAIMAAERIKGNTGFYSFEEFFT